LLTRRDASAAIPSSRGAAAGGSGPGVVDIGAISAF
jgi:hypothetical protein